MKTGNNTRPNTKEPQIICSPRSPLNFTLKELLKIANKDSPVLFVGPTGTGKELLADYLVQNSNRKDKPFNKINCIGLPEHIIESELFGHEKGAFTGATV